MNIKQYRQWHQHLVDANRPNPKPLVMGIVNVTPDSFYDGGKHCDHAQAIEHAHSLIDKGADILDIGGESTRPGADPVSAQEELERILPVIEAVRKNSDIIISVDTYKPIVMQACIEHGANMINDISSLPDQQTRQWLASKDIPVCLMHMLGSPKTMQIAPGYPLGVINTIVQFFQDRTKLCKADGIRDENIIIDPGFGFGKSVKDNLLVLQKIKKFTDLHFPVLLGVSRKSTLRKISGCSVEESLAPSLAATLYSQIEGVSIFRTHDVAETVATITTLEAIITQQDTEEA